MQRTCRVRVVRVRVPCRVPCVCRGPWRGRGMCRACAVCEQYRASSAPGVYSRPYAATSRSGSAPSAGRGATPPALVPRQKAPPPPTALRGTGLATLS
eukprot:scaffold75839_cov51-Phaeocystis_antarctica.AAC.1